MEYTVGTFSPLKLKEPILEAHEVGGALHCHALHIYPPQVRREIPKSQSGNSNKCNHFLSSLEGKKIQRGRQQNL